MKMDKLQNSIQNPTCDANPDFNGLTTNAKTFSLKNKIVKQTKLVEKHKYWIN